MDDGRADGRKYIIGWLTFPPGGRDGFLEVARGYVATCRAEDGCLFFEMNPSADDPDVVTVTECFRDAAAHRAHLDGAAFRAFWPELARRCLHGRFENVIADMVAADSVDFGGPAPPPARVTPRRCGAPPRRRHQAAAVSSVSRRIRSEARVRF